jgi:hypothetical protein
MTRCDVTSLQEIFGVLEMSGEKEGENNMPFGREAHDSFLRRKTQQNRHDVLMRNNFAIVTVVSA